MNPLFHVADVAVCGVAVLTVVYWVDEAVLVFVHGAEEVGFDPVDHAVVFDKVVLKRCAYFFVTMKLLLCIKKCDYFVA